MAKRIVSIPHKFRLVGIISFRKDYSPPPLVRHLDPTHRPAAPSRGARPAARPGPPQRRPRPASPMPHRAVPGCLGLSRSSALSDTLPCQAWLPRPKQVLGPLRRVEDVVVPAAVVVPLPTGRKVRPSRPSRFTSSYSYLPRRIVEIVNWLPNCRES